MYIRILDVLVLRLGYVLDDRGFEVQFPARSRDLSLLHSIQTSCKPHTAFCLMGTEYSFPGAKAAGV
jgi:hypothetical protein